MAALALTYRRVVVNWYPLTLAGLMLAGAVLRLAGLGDYLLTYDETFGALVARSSIPALVAATAGDVHPPLGYLVSWVMVHLAGSDSPLVLRLPGALLSVAAMPLLVIVARRLGLSRAAELAGLALFALNPFQVFYAHDARMYPLLQAAVLGALAAGLSRRWLWMAAGLTVALWTHNYGLIYTAVLGLLMLARELRLPVLSWDGERLVQVADLRGPVLAVIVPLVLWSPWAVALAGQMRTVSEGYWIMPLSLGQAVQPLFTMAWGASLPQALNGPAALVIYALLLFAVLKARRRRQHGALVWLVIAPFVLAGLVSLAWRPIYLFRAFIGTAGPMCLLLGWALADGVRARYTMWAAVMIAPLTLLSLANRGPALEVITGENGRALEVIEAGWREGDIVVHGNVGSLLGFLVTAPDHMPNYLLPVQPGSVGVLTPETRAALGLCEGPLTPWAIVADCGGERRARVWQRAWLVWGASQTISGVEDQAIAFLLDYYPNVQVLDIDDVYNGPMPVEGGVWLLSQP